MTRVGPGGYAINVDIEYAPLVSQLQMSQMHLGVDEETIMKWKEKNKY